MKSIPTTVRVVTKLEEKGRQQAADVTLGGILKVKVIVRDQCRLVLSHVINIFNDSGAYDAFSCTGISAEP
jgi:hypothetical protein